MVKVNRWMIKAVLPLVALLLSTVSASAYNGLNLNLVDSPETVEEEPAFEPLKLKLKPTIGLGVGMFTFYGDVANNHSSYHPTVSRIGYDLRVSNPLTEYLDLSFYALFGTVGANERTLTRNLNFESKITTGGMTLSYNFDHFLKEDRIVSPYVSLGIESVEFLSKTDLFDENGNMYHYWSDGSIRNLAEDDANAELAIEIYRDYTYETDLRELNLDDLGKYPERSWSIPVGVGATFHLSDKFDFKVGTSMHFTMTDLVDNVTGESVGNRAGTAGNDKFLFTSFSVNYNLQLGNRDDEDLPFDPDQMDVRMYDLADADMDSVSDFFDNCPGTPEGVPVDKYGCPLDQDKDGVPDYLDEEANSAEGAAVDEQGITLDSTYWADRYARFTDSTGAYADYKEVRSEVVGGEYDPGRVATTRRTYSVSVGGEEKTISSDMVDYILSLEDVETEVDDQGNVSYNIGSWNAIDSAMMTQIELQNQGIEGTLAGQQGDRPLTQDEIAEAASNANIPNIPTSNKTVFRVQIGAFSQQLSPDVFRGAPKLVVVQGEDGLTKYLTGSFTDFQSAANHKIDMVLKGYDGAFIVAYKDGKRVPLDQAGATPVTPGDTELEDTEKPMSVNKELVKFKVQVGAFNGDVPTEMLDLYIRLGNVEAKRSGNVTKYVVGEYDSYQEAQAAKAQFATQGAGDAFVIGDFNGNLISAEEAIKLLNE